jgi:hypothetical protein
MLFSASRQLNANPNDAHRQRKCSARSGPPWGPRLRAHLLIWRSSPRRCNRQLRIILVPGRAPLRIPWQVVKHIRSYMSSSPSNFWRSYLGRHASRPSRSYTRLQNARRNALSIFDLKRETECFVCPPPDALPNRRRCCETRLN